MKQSKCTPNGNLAPFAGIPRQTEPWAEVVPVRIVKTIDSLIGHFSGAIRIQLFGGQNRFPHALAFAHRVIEERFVT